MTAAAQPQPPPAVDPQPVPDTEPPPAPSGRSHQRQPDDGLQVLDFAAPDHLSHLVEREAPHLDVLVGVRGGRVSPAPGSRSPSSRKKFILSSQ